MSLKHNDLRESIQFKTQRQESNVDVYTTRKAQGSRRKQATLPHRRWQPDRSSVRPPALVVEGSLLKRGAADSSHSAQMYKLQASDSRPGL